MPSFLTSIIIRSHNHSLVFGPPSAEHRHRPLIWLLILWIPGRTQLTAGYRVDRFLDLGDGIVSDLVQLYVRHVRHLVSWHNAVDDRRGIDAERFAQFGSQQARLFDGKSLATTGPCQRGKVRIGKFDRLPKWKESDALGFQRD